MDHGQSSLIATAVIGSLLVLTGIGLLIRSLVKIRGWTRAEGIIVAAHKTYDTSYNTWYYAPVAEYVPAGSNAPLRVTGSVRASWESAVRVGGRVSVVYDPAQPENAHIATPGQLHFVPLLFVFMGIVVAACGVVFNILF